MFGLGLPEILLILVVVLLFFGASKLPEIGRALGRSLGEFKKGMQDFSESDSKDKKEKEGSEKK